MSFNQNISYTSVFHYLASPWPLLDVVTSWGGHLKTPGPPDHNHPQPPPNLIRIALHTAPLGLLLTVRVFCSYWARDWEGEQRKKDLKTGKANSIYDKGDGLLDGWVYTPYHYELNVFSQWAHCLQSMTQCFSIVRLVTMIKITAVTSQSYFHL